MSFLQKDIFYIHIHTHTQIYFIYIYIHIHFFSSNINRPGDSLCVRSTAAIKNERLALIEISFW
jgi:hypothetical protein